MSNDDNRPLGGDGPPQPPVDPLRGDFGVDPRMIRPRAPRETRTVPWQGCHLFPADDLAEVPINATLRIRVGLSWDGEEIWFDRKPFPTALTTADLQKRFGPGRYTIALVSVDPTAPGSGLRGPPLAMKTIEVRARGEWDVGEDPWPINTSQPETPRGLVEECARRAAMRGDAEPAPTTGRYVGDPRGASAYGAPGFGPRGRDEEEEEGDDPGPPPPGYRWSQYRGQLVLVASSQADAGSFDPGELRFPPGGLAAPQPPAPPPAPTGLAALLTRPPEELLLLIGGGLKLFKELSGGGERAASVEVERERIKAEYELRKQEQAQQHQMFLEQMKLQMAQAAAAHPVPQAPPVNIEEVRAAARNEARVEAMQRELERQRAEITAAKQARLEPQHQPQPDLMTQIAKIRETAAALGMERKAAGGAAPPPPPPPSGFEQLADMLDTQGGKVLVEKLADRFFGDGGSAPPQQAQHAAPPPQPQQLPPQYAVSPEQQVFYGGDPEPEDQPD